MSEAIELSGPRGLSGLVTRSAKTRGAWQYTWFVDGEPAGDVNRSDPRAALHEALVDGLMVVRTHGRVSAAAVRDVEAHRLAVADALARWDAGDDEVEAPPRPWPLVLVLLAPAVYLLVRALGRVRSDAQEVRA